MKKVFYILSAAVIMITACTMELTPEQQSVLSTTVAPQEGDMARVTFSITIPETALYATQTRAQHLMGEQPSIANGDLYVAVFGAGQDEKLGGNLQHFLKATLKSTILHDLTDEEDATKTYTYEYEVLLPLSSNPLVLDFMAGACDSEGNLFTLDNPIPVKYEKDVMSLLYSVNGYAAYWQRKRIAGVFPRKLADGSYEMTQYIDPNAEPNDPEPFLPIADQDYVAEAIPELHNVQLIRNFAKITYTASNDAPFTLNGFYLVDTPLSGSVAPYSTAAGYNTAYTTATSSGAILGAYQGFVLSQQLSSDIPSDIEDKFLEPGRDFAYMYERTIPTYSMPAFGESGALLKVTWKQTASDASLRGTTRYYKVSFVDKNGYIPILRNLQYDFEISDINADTHPTSAAAAYAGGWLGDVSANVATAMLDEISNNKSRIKVSEMSKTSIGTGKSFTIDFYFYPVDGNPEVVVTNGKQSTAAGGKVVTIAANDDGGDAIANVSAVTVTSNSNGTDNHGTITVTTTDSEHGVVKTGKVRILGQVQGMRAMYRDVVFTVMEKQVFANGEGDDVVNSSVTPLASDAANQETTVTIVLPDGLPRDIFPLQIKIESEQNSLYSVGYTDTSLNKYIPALPVKYGESAFSTTQNNYYFIKTITFDEYATLSGVSYEYTNEFPCKFKTRLASGNATSIKINDLNGEYFVEKTLTLSVQ